jgi:hypothetical protein
VKKILPVRASHVNAGTSIAQEGLRSNGLARRELGHPKLTVSIESGDTTAYGGLALAARLVARLKLPQAIDQSLCLLQSHRPFHESDHVLTHVYNLFVGGENIEDIAELQHSQAVCRMLGAARLPDPTTAGDFLRRFKQIDLTALDRVTDAMHLAAWSKHYGRKRQVLGLLDIDSHVHHVYGDQKEGADFTYKGGFGYHPLILSLAGTQECLRLINRPGNIPSADGAAEQIDSVAGLLQSRFERVLVRGDSAFARQDIYEACERHGFDFAFVSSPQRNFEALADAIPQRRWQVFEAHPASSHGGCTGKPRKRGRNLRRTRARERGKRDLRLEKQWMAEIAYRPERSEVTYRLVIRRQRIEESCQGRLFEVWRYRYAITNLPRRTTTAEVLRLTYGRCDQENIVEQLQSGIAAMRMPTGSFLANAALLACARIAHNLKAWLAMLALPEEVMRWEWKRFRKAFVFVAARVAHRARQRLVRIADSHRFAEALRAGIVRLQT